MVKAFTFHSDPGHGWLAVKRNLLVKLNIIGDISRYSYQNGQTVYLEEDCDLTRFVLAHREAYAIDPAIKNGARTDTRSHVRSYCSFSKE